MVNRSRELGSCVDDLVRAATPEANPRELQKIVEATLDAFEGASSDERNRALKTIGAALNSAQKRGEQILLLTLGAIVEAGGSPEIAWPYIASNFETLLNKATNFAANATKHAKDEHVETAIEKSGAVVAKKDPQGAAAWNSLPSRSLAAVACLTRSKKVRTTARKSASLLESAWPLSDVVPEVGVFLQALRILDDATLIVLAPALGAGWKIEVDAIPSNLELHVLLAAALSESSGKGSKPRLPSARLSDPEAISIIREGAPTDPPPAITFPFRLFPWHVLDEGEDEDEAAIAEHAIPFEDVPANLPMFGDLCILILREITADTDEEPLSIEPTFLGLRPELRIVDDLTTGVVVKMMVNLAQAASSVEENEDDDDQPPASTTKPTSKAKAKAKTKTQQNQPKKTKSKPSPTSKPKSNAKSPSKKKKTAKKKQN